MKEPPHDERNPCGLIGSVHEDTRLRGANGLITADPWDDQTHGGMQIPTEGEVSRILPEWKCPCQRDQLTSVAYEFERVAT
ncbi:MAG: hypothetical protein JNM66_07725 [Bryobacterales bacterium]|nr:hypothetical protein [Bryobacterales bacterium]